MHILQSIILIFITSAACMVHRAPGSFEISGRSGVPAMHAALLQNGNVMFLDKVETWTNLELPSGYPAYSSIYDPTSKSLRPLSVSTSPFCCGGTFLADGRLTTFGGNGNLSWLDPTVDDGWDGIRYLDAHGQQEAWSEPGNKLASRRWYASAQTMSDGTIFVAAGSMNGVDYFNLENNNPTYEILDRNGISSGQNVRIDILVRNQPYWMYPFLHLLKDGTLFVFTGKQSQTFDVAAGKVVKDMPDLPGFFRTYPNSGGSVMLPMSRQNDFEPAVMICGGGEAQTLITPCEDSCGTIRPMSAQPAWIYTYMPERRTMVEGVNLLDGTILWLNGAQVGAQGFGIADSPALDALIYDPRTEQWATAGTSTIARMYHSVALLLRDGTVLVSGSNPNEMPLHDDQLNSTNQYTKFPTEFRNEIWTPPYLQGDQAKQRPTAIRLSESTLRPGQKFTLSFKPAKLLSSVEVVMHRNGFVTHSLHMGQVMYQLEDSGWISYTDGTAKVVAWIPDIKLAPGPYFMYVMANGVPGIADPVMIEY